MGKSKQKSKTLSYVLWFLIGGFGAHRFYLKRKRSGFLLLGYTFTMTMVDILILEIFPNVKFFYDGTFSLLTSVVLLGILLRDAFQIPKWVHEINYIENGPAVFD